MADCSRVLEKLSFGRALVVNDAPFRSGGDVWTVAFVEAVGHDDDGKCVLCFEKSQKISSLKNGSKAQGDEGKRKHCRK